MHVLINHDMRLKAVAGLVLSRTSNPVGLADCPMASGHKPTYGLVNPCEKVRVTDIRCRYLRINRQGSTRQRVKSRRVERRAFVYHHIRPRQCICSVLANHWGAINRIYTILLVSCPDPVRDYTISAPPLVMVVAWGNGRWTQSSTLNGRPFGSEKRKEAVTWERKLFCKITQFKTFCVQYTGKPRTHVVREC